MPSAARSAANPEATWSGHDGLGVIEALAQSMRQIQELQVKALTKEDASDDAPEAVKTAMTTLPVLGLPEGDQGGLQFQDWMIQVTTSMQDLSASSGSWWEAIKETVVQAYNRWLSAAPLERLSIEPGGSTNLVLGKYVRINARACAMVVQAVPESVKSDLIARRATQSMPLLLFRLFTVYQPGGAGERTVILQRLQGSDVAASTEECLRQLRAWPRWVQRCKDMGMAVPDGTVLARGLTTLTSSTITKVPDAMFRTQLVRATLRIDQQPALEDVMKYQQHLQAEVENIAGSVVVGSQPKLRAAAVGGSPTSAASSKPECKYFMKPTGCRRGAKCPYCHDMNALPKAERARKCLTCGAEDHRHRDCPTRIPRLNPAKSQPGGESPKGRGRGGEPESETSPKGVASVEVAQGQVLSWEAILQAAAQVAGSAPTEPKAPSMRVLSIRGPGPGDGDGAYALVDSGATHPLRRARCNEEWNLASPVVVHLAGGEVIELRINEAGTLLVPMAGSTRSSSTAPIVPLGSLVGVLGYKMEWYGSRCRLTGREGDVLNLRVRDGCPEITERQALDLISRIEDKKLEDLRNATTQTRSTVRAAAMALNKSWFDHLISYCRSGIGAEALRAIQDAPFFQDLPREALQGLSEADPIDNGWDALKGLQHLNRRTRRRLWQSKNWVVHLFAGKKPNDEVMFLERQGFVVLELDLERGKSHDLCNPLVWRAVEWGARNGRVCSVIGGPPQSTFMLRRSMAHGPEALRSNDYPYGGWYGQSTKDIQLVNKHTGLFAKMIYLHALATAGRCEYPGEPGDLKEVGFMLEQPRDPRRYLQLTDPLAEDADFSEVVSIAIREQRVRPRMLKMSAEQWKEHVRKGHLPFRSDCMTCVAAGATGRRHARVEHPTCFVLSADVSGPLKVPGLDADARGAFPKPHKYMFVAKLKIPRTFVDDGRGSAVEYDPGELEVSVPPEEDSFDYEDPEPASGVGAVPGGQEDDEAADEDSGEDQPRKRGEHDDELDVTGPDTVNLLFATALQDNKGATVLEAIQDVVMYCWSLNIPIVRFHCDRGMEFYAKATRQWIKYHGMRFTTSEGGLHQQNGMVENAVRYVKQRARTLLIGAKLPQRLWPQAVGMAVSMQRASVLGMETRLAAPFGAKVLVRRREYGGAAEPGKPDDLAPRWLEGRYLGLSETVRRGHVVYLSGDDGEKFVHTVNVRVGLEDQPGPELDVEADLPGPPSRRLRGKASGSGDVVAVSKAQVVVGSEDLEKRARKLLEDWSQEEAEELMVQIALSLSPAERVYGVFRHGGRVGLTKATYDRPWIARVFVKALRQRCLEAEFTALYLSVNTTREIHVDCNNLTGMQNYVYPIAMPPRGGDLWMELRDGDVVQGKIIEMMDQNKKPRFGCIQPLTSGTVISFNPHRRHAVLPWKGMRVVVVGYTPGVPQNLSGPERAVLAELGFPIPAEVEMTSPMVALRVFSVSQIKYESTVQEEKAVVDEENSVLVSDGSTLHERGVESLQDWDESWQCQVQGAEELEHWDMFLPLEDGDPRQVPKVLIASCDGVPVLAKTEVTYTAGIEELLHSLKSPLTVVHNVDPSEAASSFSEWVKPAMKEISSFDKAAKKVRGSDPQVAADLKSGKAKIVPMKMVYTVKPPSEEAVSEGQLYRRKVRIVACGNMMADSGEETYAGAAPAEVVRSSLSVASMYGWDAAVLDVTAAFLQTPLNEVQCKQRILGQPPRALVRAGLCHEQELWEFTHAVYGLRESPRWWGEFRDAKMAQLNIVVGARRIKLLQCRVE
ncbi:GIP, partial [Symbiodinium sp. CCMP2456]